MRDARFDETIHAPLRLRICGLLRRVDRLDFALLRDTLGVSDATLSKHVRTLSDAGYVTSRKTASAGRSDARRVMWLALTAAGRTAFDAHVRALQEIAGPSS
ncbi:helix-turn-helix domain-containing protein [Agrococcus sediminis]|uniref:Helix-turn-helix domain-containing protein n=1 Tax=Agrococcus sediminis TaxID=2599924 RepID=A0A5M8QG04_9MICO|nr:MULTISPECIES: transcriptional regulator [Agrococcus]KAA6434967.1 helix-turn-helix domain-containing protein [Agrococcus sediminis]UOV99769.1 transcriptional regulator [Agrococcus sp. SCSIO52902]